MSSSSPLAQVHIWKEDNVCQAYGIKVRCYWELLGIHVRNFVTLCFDTHSPTNKQKEKEVYMECQLSTVQVESEQWTAHSPHQTQLEKKNGSPSPHPQGKKSGPLTSLHDMTSHWLHGNPIPKIGCHYFWPGLTALPTNTLTYCGPWLSVELCVEIGPSIIPSICC